MEYKAVSLHFVEYGEGQPVVLLHGFPLDHTIWEPLVPYLQPHARLILPDLRGFGSSPVPEGVYAMRLLAEDVEHLLDMLKIERAILVGHSMGGYVSLAFARAFPNRLAGLGLVATRASGDTPEYRSQRYQLAKMVQHKGIKAIADNMQEKLSKQAEIAASLRGIILKTQPLGVIGALKGMAERPDSTPFLSEIAVPAVVIAGGQDPFVSMEHARLMARLLGRAWLVELPENGHMLMMEKPQEVADALRQLIQAVQGFQANP